MIYVLFGEMGVGKNYVGELFAKFLDCPFFDGDDALPDDLKRKVADLKPLTHHDVRRFVHGHLVHVIRRISARTEDLVVAQALYGRRDRDWLVSALGGPGKAKLVYLPPPEVFAHMERLSKRPHGLRWMMLALMSKPFFQKPLPETAEILNRDGLDLVLQFRKISADRGD